MEVLRGLFGWTRVTVHEKFHEGICCDMWRCFMLGGWICRAGLGLYG